MLNPQELLAGIDKKVLALDPGETTGAAVFKGPKLEVTYQLRGLTTVDRALAIEGLMAEHEPEAVIVERYRVYRHKAQSHAGSDLPTVRLIGAIELLCHQHGLTLYWQTPSDAKGFITDDRLKTWKYYRAGCPHAMDAVRHGLYFLLFKHAKIHLRESHDKAAS